MVGLRSMVSNRRLNVARLLPARHMILWPPSSRTALGQSNVRSRHWRSASFTLVEHQSCIIVACKLLLLYVDALHMEC